MGHGTTLPARSVGEIMTRAPAVLHVTHPVRAAQRIFGEKPYEHLPVIQGGRLVGMLTDRDVSRFLANRPQAAELEVALAMTENPVTLSPEMLIEDVAELLARH